MNKKIFWGIVLIIIGLFYTLQQYIPESALYLYLREFFNEYFELTLPIIILLGGVIVLLFGVLEKREMSKNISEKQFIFKSTKKSEDKVEDAEEVK